MPTPVRRRLLDTAAELFTAHGIRVVGIDRVLAESGVAKSSMYVHFRTKEDLVVAYLEELGARRRAELARHQDARSVVELLAERAAAERGCPFVNAAAEYPDHAGIRAVAAEHRSWLAGLLADLVPARHPDPAGAARALLQVATGAQFAAYVDGDDSAARTARRTAATLLGARSRRGNLGHAKPEPA